MPSLCVASTPNIDLKIQVKMITKKSSDTKDACRPKNVMETPSSMVKVEYSHRQKYPYLSSLMPEKEIH